MLDTILPKYYNSNTMRTILQIPLSTELRDSASLAAKSQGFSSLQEAVRILLHKLATHQLEFGVFESVQMSPTTEERYLKIMEEFKSGEGVRTANNVTELMKQLHEG